MLCFYHKYKDLSKQFSDIRVLLGENDTTVPIEIKETLINVIPHAKIDIIDEGH